jgi:hypothetical protein
MDCVVIATAELNGICLFRIRPDNVVPIVINAISITNWQFRLIQNGVKKNDVGSNSAQQRRINNHHVSNYSTEK